MARGSVRRAYGLGNSAQSVAEAAMGDELRSMLGEEPLVEGSPDEPRLVTDEGEFSSESLPPVEEPKVVEPKGPTLDEAAALLLTKVPDYVRVFINEQVRVHSRYPAWAFIMGSVLRQYEVGRLQAPLLDPSWFRDLKSLGPELGVAFCQFCAKEFKELHYRQKFCSNECGYAAEARAKSAA